MFINSRRTMCNGLFLTKLFHKAHKAREEGKINKSAKAQRHCDPTISHSLRYWHTPVNAGCVIRSDINFLVDRLQRDPELCVGTPTPPLFDNIYKPKTRKSCCDITTAALSPQ